MSNLEGVLFFFGLIRRPSEGFVVSTPLIPSASFGGEKCSFSESAQAGGHYQLLLGLGGQIDALVLLSFPLLPSGKRAHEGQCSEDVVDTAPG